MSATLAPWSLPWYYLGDLICLLYGQHDRSKSFYRSLIDLSDHELNDVLTVSGCDDSSDPPVESPLVQRLHAEVTTWPPRDAYPWTDPWPCGLEVRVRSFAGTPLGALPPEEFLIGPTAVVLPWPFPGKYGAALLDRVNQAQQSEIVIPMLRTSGTDPDYDADTCAFGYAMLEAADYLVTVGRTQTLVDLQTNTMGSLIEQRAHRVPVPNRAYFFTPKDVAVPDPDPLVDSRKTRLTSTGAELTLKLGIAAPHLLMFDSWPCGA